MCIEYSCAASLGLPHPRNGHAQPPATVPAIAAKARAEKKQIPAGLVNDEYAAAVSALDTLIENYRDTAAKSLVAQAMYWAGDASLRAKDYEKSFLYLKRTVFEYPETEWARRARGLLLQESKTFEKLE